MNQEGFNRLNRALRDAGIEATIEPEPDKDHDVRFVTIETNAATAPPAHVLNALAKNGLMHFDQTEIPGDENWDPPQFVVLGAQPGSITLEDEVVGPGFYGLERS